MRLDITLAAPQELGEAPHGRRRIIGVCLSMSVIRKSLFSF